MKIRTGILVFAVLLYGSCKNAGNDNFYQQALRDAEMNQKFILLDFTALWCGGCKGYDKYVFGDSSVRNKLEKNFILLKIEGDKPENSFLTKQYKIEGYPHIVLIDKNERILGSIVGFDLKFVDDPDLFQSRLSDIINAQDEIKRLRSIFISDTTNMEAVNNLLNACTKVNQYIEVQHLNDLLVRIDPTPERLFEFHFNQAINSAQSSRNPEPLLSFIRENPDLDNDHKGYAYSTLLYFYEGIGDIKNQDIYYQIMVKLNPDYYTKNYARFLFENNLKIDTAIRLTNECLQHAHIRNDHWGQFLLAHSLAYSGKTEEAVEGFSSWMEKNKNIWISGDSYWSLYFYASFANFHQVDLQRALDYIQIAEKNENMKEQKILMAEILFKLGRVDESVLKLKESLKLIDSQDEYNRINKLIAEYSKGGKSGS
jgi:tetratricopeptide (TPR) repeat protein